MEIVYLQAGCKELNLVNERNEPQLNSDEEEVHLLKIPAQMNPLDLINSKFSLDKKSKFKMQSDVYCMKKISDTPKPELFISSHSLKVFRPVSRWQIEKLIEKDEKEEMVENNEKVPLPEKFTRRHSIFGFEYEERIKLHKEIQEKLQQARKRLEEKEEASKKKKKPKVENDEYDDKSLLIAQLLEAKMQSRKIMREENNRKKEPSLETPVIKSETDSVEHKGKKSKKKNKNKAENHEEYTTISIKKEPLSESENVQSDLIEKKKKKKKNRKDSEATLLAPDDTTNVIDEPPAKKRKPSILSSTIIKEGTPEFKPDVSAITTVKKEKKKKKRKSEGDDNQSNLMQDMMS